MVHVGGDTRVHDIELVLARAGAVTGAIVDSAGEPFQGVLVRALRLQSDGERTVATLATWPRLTDDRGRYRLFGLPPGSYLIVASLDAAEPAAGRSRAPGFAPVYYPGTAHVESAQPVQVELGGDIAGVDLAVCRDIDGAGHRNGAQLEWQSTRRARVARRQPSLGQRGARAASSRRSGPRGRSSCADVPPGDYVVQAQAEPGPGTRCRVRRRVHHGRRERSAAGHDQDVGRRDARGPLRRRGPIESAHACAIDSRRADGCRSQSAGWSWTSRSGRARRWAVLSHGTLRADATDVSRAAGVVSEVGDDRRRGRHRQAFRLRVRRRDRSLMRRSCSRARAPALRARLPTGPARRATAFTVVAFSVDRANWFAGSRHLKRASSSSNGSFDVNGLPPGEYFVAAVDTVGPGDWQAPNTLEALVQGAARVTVREGQAQTIGLRLLRR